MRKLKKPVSIYEALRKKWKIRIMLEKAYTEDAALWMTDRIESLISHMQYGYALVAYYKQDGTFKFVKATLLPYEKWFPSEIRYTSYRRAHHLLGCRTTGVEKLPAGKLSGMETDQLTVDN